MNRILIQWKSYISEKSKLGIVFDFIFILVFILMLIPSTRRILISNVLRIVSTAPQTLEKAIVLNDSDYQWSVNDLEGNSVVIDSLRRKVLFINFWATWCAPCVAEMPSIKELYENYGDKVEFLLISNEEAPVLIKFLKDKEYSLPVYLSKGLEPLVLKHNAIPSTYIISASGELLMSKQGSANWNGSSVHLLLDSLVAN